MGTENKKTGAAHGLLPFDFYKRDSSQKFLISATVTPARGPYAKDAISAGRSEKSNFKNAGTKGTENSNSISTKESADKTAVPTKARKELRFF